MTVAEIKEYIDEQINEHQEYRENFFTPIEKYCRTLEKIKSMLDQLDEPKGSKEQSIWISNYQNVNNNEMIACATRTDFVTHYLTLTLTRSAPSTSPEHNNTRNGVVSKRLYFFAQKQVNVYYFYRE